MSSTAQRHNLPTRLLHASLVLTVCVQLGSSLVMRIAWGSHPGNIFFPIHEYAGMAAFALAFLFWVTVIARRVGTEPGALFPWLSPARRAALRADIATHLDALRRFSLPQHDGAAPLPSAIHGLGLLLVTFMGVSGTYWYLMSQAGLGRSVFVRPVIELHGAFGNLVWAYIFGHAALGLLHHVSKNMPLTTMWSFRP